MYELRSNIFGLHVDFGYFCVYVAVVGCIRYTFKMIVNCTCSSVYYISKRHSRSIPPHVATSMRWWYYLKPEECMPFPIGDFYAKIVRDIPLWRDGCLHIIFMISRLSMRGPLYFSVDFYLILANLFQLLALTYSLDTKPHIIGSR